MGKTAVEFFTGANVFLNASKTLDVVGQAGLSQMKDVNSGLEILGRMYIPGIVMQAFAAELYLKALIVYEGKQIKKLHKLDALFVMLDEVEKNIITASMMAEIRKAKGISESEYGKTELMDDFTKAANIFEDWRYFFESGTVSADLDFMKALNNVLYIRCKSLI